MDNINQKKLLDVRESIVVSFGHLEQTIFDKINQLRDEIIKINNDNKILRNENEKLKFKITELKKISSEITNNIEADLKQIQEIINQNNNGNN